MLKNAQKVSGQVALRFLLFGDYGWNKGDTPRHTVRGKDWKDVRSFLQSLASRQEELQSSLRTRLIAATAFGLMLLIGISRS